MKKFIYLFVWASVLSSCSMGIKGNGNVQREERSVENFDRIEISGAYDVYLRQGETPSLTIEADDNLLPLIKSSVNKGELEIESEKNFRKFKKLALYITIRQLEEIEMSGACSVHTEGEIRSASLELESSGACEADMDLRCDELKIDISGAADFTLRGFAERLEIQSSGACEINAFELRTARTSIEVSGAGEVDVYVTDELDVEASGASEIRYMGNPQNIKQESSGASSVKPKN